MWALERLFGRIEIAQFRIALGHPGVLEPIVGYLPAPFSEVACRPPYANLKGVRHFLEAGGFPGFKIFGFP